MHSLNATLDRIACFVIQRMVDAGRGTQKGLLALYKNAIREMATVF
jgi:hypothetical protein